MNREELLAAAKRLEELRKQAKIHVATMCQLFGITRQTWWFWQKRTYTPYYGNNPELVLLIARGIKRALDHKELPAPAVLHKKNNRFKHELYVKRTIVKHMNK